ncbi:MAG: N-acetyltransferase family protein [Actinomycetota bacterium]
MNRPPDDSVTVRPASPADAGVIASIRVEGWRTAYRGQLDDDRLEGMSASADEARWRAHLEAPPAGHHGFVAERGDEAIGFATCGPDRKSHDGPAVGELYAMYVRPSAIGTGVGRALMARVLDTLRGDGYGEAALWVLASNVNAHRFYEAAGWTRDPGTKVDVLDGFTVREVRYRYRFQDEENHGHIPPSDHDAE